MLRNNIQPIEFPDLSFLGKSEEINYIYGAGITATKLHNYLSSLGITIKGFVVDIKTKDSLFDVPIFEFSQINEVPINLILGFVPTKHTVEEIKLCIKEKFKSFNFLAYDFSFLSFGYFDRNYLSSKNFKYIVDHLEDELSVKSLIGYVKSRNSGDFSFCESYYDSNQYFPENVINFSQNEIFVDCGVFDGETIKEFISKKEDFKFVYGFEPDPVNYLKSVEKLNYISTDKLKVFNIGSWNKKDILRFNSSSERISEIDPDGVEEIVVDSIDNLLNGIPVTFIKMDVEGAELNSLIGAYKIIKTQRPKLAICIYHKPEDILEIINWVNSLGLNYKFFIRLHTRFSQELVLYCI